MVRKPPTKIDELASDERRQGVRAFMRQLTNGVGIALVLSAPGAIWWFHGHVAQAQQHEERIQKVEEAIAVISKAIDEMKDIAIKQESAEQAQRATIKWLCDQKKLNKSDCSAYEHPPKTIAPRDDP